MTGTAGTGSTPASSGQTTDQTVPGIGSFGIGESGVGKNPTGNSSGASQLNVPGGQNVQKTGSALQAMQGNTGGASSLNLPGSATQQDPDAAIDDASKVGAAIGAQGKSLIDQGTQGGVNGLNTATSVGSGISAGDNSGMSNSRRGESGAGSMGSAPVQFGTVSSPVNFGTPTTSVVNFGYNPNGSIATKNPDGSTTTTTLTPDGNGTVSTTISKDGTTATSTANSSNGSSQQSSSGTTGPITIKKNNGSTPSDDAGRFCGREYFAES